MEDELNVKLPEYFKKMIYSKSLCPGSSEEMQHFLIDVKHRQHAFARRKEMLPISYWTGIQMNEVRFGVIADSSDFTFHGHLP